MFFFFRSPRRILRYISLKVGMHSNARGNPCPVTELFFPGSHWIEKPRVEHDQFLFFGMIYQNRRIFYQPLWIAYRIQEESDDVFLGPPTGRFQEALE